jgi:hypothetical protein
VTAGLSCHPFSAQRFKQGTTKNTGRAEDHDEYSTVVDDFPRMIESRKPGDRLFACLTLLEFFKFAEGC